MDIAGASEQSAAVSDGAMTALSDSAEIRLAASDTLATAEVISPAADIAALAAVLFFAAGKQGGDISSGLHALLRSMQHPNPVLRPSAQKVLTSCMH